jgi:Tfp pilus assembly protein PilE
MGQQQLLLIILGVIVVGIAVAVGITMFSDSAISANRDAVTNDLVNLASRAQQFYRRPTSLGGGGNSFTGLTADAAGLAKLTNKATNGNGSYVISTAGAGSGTAAVVHLEGTGTEINGTLPVKVHVQVWADRDSVWTIN